jgi:hypothetical protein
MSKVNQDVGSLKRKRQIQMRTDYEPWWAQIEDWV